MSAGLPTFLQLPSLGTIWPDHRVELAGSRIIVAGCNVTNQGREDVLRQVDLKLQQAGARPGFDLVRLQLEGCHPAGAEPAYVEQTLGNRYYHLVVGDNTRPDYLTEQIDLRTTEGKFIQSMLSLKELAAASGASICDTNYGALSVSAIEDAWYYGSDALKQKKVAVRHVD